MAIEDDIIARESGGDPNARNSRSSAAGAGQFIDSTWLAMLQSRRPDLVQGRSREDLLNLKMDPALSKEMTAAYAADNNAVLTKAGLPVTPGTTYLAHFAGPGGAVKVLSADPTTPVANLLGADAVAANPHIRNMTAGDLKVWADGGKRTSQPQAAVPSVIIPTQNPTNPPGNNQNLGNTFAELAPATIPALTVPSPERQMAAPPAGEIGPSFDDSAFAPRTYARQKMKRREVLA